MTNENKIIPNMKKEDEDEYEYEYVLELEKFNNLPKQMTYKETWLNIGKNLKNFLICSKENKSVTHVKPVTNVKNKVIKPQVKKSQVIQTQNITPQNKN
jgi:hypothetical protein